MSSNPLAPGGPCRAPGKRGGPDPGGPGTPRPTGTAGARARPTAAGAPGPCGFARIVVDDGHRRRAAGQGSFGRPVGSPRTVRARSGTAAARSGAHTPRAPARSAPGSPAGGPAQGAAPICSRSPGPALRAPDRVWSASAPPAARRDRGLLGPRETVQAGAQAVQELGLRVRPGPLPGFQDVGLLPPRAAASARPRAGQRQRPLLDEVGEEGGEADLRARPLRRPPRLLGGWRSTGRARAARSARRPRPRPGRRPGARAVAGGWPRARPAPPAGEACREQRQPAQHRLVGRRSCAPGGVQDVADAALARRQPPQRRPRDVHRRLQLGGDLRRGQQGVPGRREQQRQRLPPGQTAEADDAVPVGGAERGRGQAPRGAPGLLQEEGARSRPLQIVRPAREGQAADHQLPRAQEAQPHPGRDHQLQPRRPADERPQDGPGVDQVLEVVQHQQQRPVAQRRGQGRHGIALPGEGDPQHAGDGQGDPAGRLVLGLPGSDVGQRHHEDPVAERGLVDCAARIDEAAGGLQRQPGLRRCPPARPG